MHSTDCERSPVRLLNFIYFVNDFSCMYKCTCNMCLSQRTYVHKQGIPVCKYIRKHLLTCTCNERCKSLHTHVYTHATQVRECMYEKKKKQIYDFISHSSFMSLRRLFFSHLLWVHKYIHAYIYICMHIYMHRYVRAYIYTFVHTHTCTHMHTYIRRLMYARMLHTFAFMCTYVCKCTYISIKSNTSQTHANSFKSRHINKIECEHFSCVKYIQ